MTIYFSAQTNGFYDDRIQPLADMPKDAKSITVEQHSALLTAQSSGMKIVAGQDGLPIAIAENQTADEITKALKVEAALRLAQAGVTIERIIQAVIKGATTMEADDVKAWVAYMDALRACLRQSTLTEIPTRPDYPAGT